jgi:hypothetical protein
MIFGESVVAAPSGAPAAWIRAACRGADFTVGALVPDAHPSVLRIDAPPSDERFWSNYRELFATIASVGIRHTSSADQAWCAIWEGHGFDSSTRHIGWRGPIDEATSEWLEQERARLRDENEQRNMAIRSELGSVPRFAMPHRTYYLVTGAASAVTELRDPAEPGSWQRPDLFWPDDRAWFVATDVDVWSLFVGGDDDFLTEVADRVPTHTEFVPRDRPLEPED